MEAHVSLTHSHHWLMYKELSSMFEYIKEVYVPHELKLRLYTFGILLVLYVHHIYFCKFPLSCMLFCA